MADMEGNEGTFCEFSLKGGFVSRSFAEIFVSQGHAEI